MWRLQWRAATARLSLCSQRGGGSRAIHSAQRAHHTLCTKKRPALSHRQARHAGRRGRQSDCRSDVAADQLHEWLQRGGRGGRNLVDAARHGARHIFQRRQVWDDQSGSTPIYAPYRAAAWRQAGQLWRERPPCAACGALPPQHRFLAVRRPHASTAQATRGIH